MAVRLLREKFSPSIPDWLRDAISSHKSTGKFANYPLDTVEYREKPVPTKLSQIQDDWENGYAPVILWRNGDTSIIDREGYSDSSNPTYKFKATFKNNIPYGYRDNLTKNGWNWVKEEIAKYGVMLNREGSLASVSDKRKSRTDARSKIPKIIDPYDDSNLYMKNAKKDAVALRYKKSLDKLYDELNVLFDEGMAVAETLTDRDANECFRDMKNIAEKYNSCIKAIDNILGDEVHGWRNFDEEGDFDAKRFRNTYDDINRQMNDFKAKWNI